MDPRYVKSITYCFILLQYQFFYLLYFLDMTAKKEDTLMEESEDVGMFSLKDNLQLWACDSITIENIDYLIEDGGDCGLELSS